MAQAAAVTRNDKSFASDAARWTAVQNRDPRADGHFLFAVKTTGVYCRPSCAARPAKRENVSFHASTGAAEAAGFRPCKRCRPVGASPAESRAASIARACRAIDASEDMPRLDGLARAAGMSRFHFQRVFKSVTGMTPRDYAAAARAKRLRANLGRADSVTAAIYDSGFNSSGRFYEASKDMLGMTPKAFRAGGQGETIRFALGQSSLGPVLVAATDKGVCAILFGDKPNRLKAELTRRFPCAALVAGDRDFSRLVGRVIALVEHPAKDCDLPLDLRGTAFQRRVWQALMRIPAGRTATYTEVAKRIGKPKAVRAVAGACAANHLAVVVPCHRVVRCDGDLAGYYWGVSRKRTLLARESKSQAK